MSLTALHLLEALDSTEQSSVFYATSRGFPIEVTVVNRMITHIKGTDIPGLLDALLDNPRDIRVGPLNKPVEGSLKIPLKKFILECALAHDTRKLSAGSGGSTLKQAPQKARPLTQALPATATELRFRTAVPAKLVLGRRADCDIQLKSERGSRLHCEIRFNGRVLKVKDLGSKNGTYLNGDQVSESSARPGDLLTVADEVFQLVVDDSA